MISAKQAKNITRNKEDILLDDIEKNIIIKAKECGEHILEYKVFLKKYDVNKIKEVLISKEYKVEQYSYGYPYGDEIAILEISWEE